MKKLLLLALTAALILPACKKKGCTDTQATNYSSKAKKDDGSCTYKPIITLNGSSTVTVNVGDTYTDAGAVAYNHDGSPVAVSSNTSAVNTATTGSYTVTYSATNQYGTTTASRTVNVVIGQSNWEGSWTVASDCGTSFPLNSAPTITIGTGTNDIVIDGMFSISIPSPFNINIASGGTANATVNGFDIIVPNQSFDIAGIGSITYSGTGTMNDLGTQFVINYTFNNSLPLVGGSGTCTATYTKQ